MQQSRIDWPSFVLCAMFLELSGRVDDPAPWHRVFWAFALGLMPVALMLLQGNLRPIQIILLIVSLPILFVGVAMSVALVKTLQADNAA